MPTKNFSKYTSSFHFMLYHVFLKCGKFWSTLPGHSLKLKPLILLLWTICLFFFVIEWIIKREMTGHIMIWGAPPPLLSCQNALKMKSSAISSDHLQMSKVRLYARKWNCNWDKSKMWNISYSCYHSALCQLFASSSLYRMVPLSIMLKKFYWVLYLL